MVYLDTNVLIYASVNQDPLKKEKSLDLLQSLIESEALVLSTLRMQEFVLTLSKLKVNHEIIKQDSDFYMNFVQVEYDYLVLKRAIESCCSHEYCKNINDVIHVYLTQKSGCEKLITFDSDFKKLDFLDSVEVEVL